MNVMKYAIRILFFCCALAGCSNNTISFVEMEQLNYPPPELKNKTGQFRPPPEPATTINAQCKITKIEKYVGGIHSWHTWPHYRLSLHIMRGMLPRNPAIKDFEYHTADLSHEFKVDQILMFIFDRNGRLYGLDNIKPVYPGSKAIENSK